MSSDDANQASSSSSTGMDIIPVDDDAAGAGDNVQPTNDGAGDSDSDSKDSGPPSSSSEDDDNSDEGSSGSDDDDWSDDDTKHQAPAPAPGVAPEMGDPSSLLSSDDIKKSSKKKSSKKSSKRMAMVRVEAEPEMMVAEKTAGANNEKLEKASNLLKQRSEKRRKKVTDDDEVLLVLHCYMPKDELQDGRLCVRGNIPQLGEWEHSIELELVDGECYWRTQILIPSRKALAAMAEEREQREREAEEAKRGRTAPRQAFKVKTKAVGPVFEYKYLVEAEDKPIRYEHGGNRQAPYHFYDEQFDVWRKPPAYMSYYGTGTGGAGRGATGGYGGYGYGGGYGYSGYGGYGYSSTNTSSLTNNPTAAQGKKPPPPTPGTKPTTAANTSYSYSMYRPKPDVYKVFFTPLFAQLLETPENEVDWRQWLSTYMKLVRCLDTANEVTARHVTDYVEDITKKHLSSFGPTLALCLAVVQGSSAELSRIGAAYTMYSGGGGGGGWWSNTTKKNAELEDWIAKLSHPSLYDGDLEFLDVRKLASSASPAPQQITDICLAPSSRSASTPTRTSGLATESRR